MPMLQLFYPPKLNLGLVWFTHTVGPFFVRLFYKLQIQVSDADLAKLRALRHQRVILMVNHPTFQDPIVVMWLSKKINKAFYYLASIEQLQSPLGPYFQRLGTYSIRRGISDRPSIKQTLSLLSQPDTHLVIFPEGGCSFQNDQVMPFRTGAIQLAFQALNREYKQHQAVSDCFVIPVTLKYRYTHDVSSVIQTLLTDLERKLGILNQAPDNDYQRLRAIATQVIRQIEQDYLEPRLMKPEPELAPGRSQTDGPESSLNHRIAYLRQHILHYCEKQLQIQTNPNALIRERTYQLQEALQTYLNVQKLDVQKLNVQKLNVQKPPLPVKLLGKSMERLLNFDAIYDGYVAEAPTPERFLDTLIRLEREVFDIDQPKTKGARVAHVSVGEPINLKDSFPAYLSSGLSDDLSSLGHRPGPGDSLKTASNGYRTQLIQDITRQIQHQAQSQLHQQQQNLRARSD